MSIQILISSIVSITSIFISNWLGRKAVKDNFQLETKDKAYKNYYVPLMKLLISANKDNLTYYWFVAAWYNAPGEHKKNTDPFSTLLKGNLELLPPSIVKIIPEYNVSTSGAAMFFGENEYRENYRHNLIKSSDLFDEIIRKSLQEASKLAKTLGYPDIAAPILESFVDMEQTDMNFPRYLPEIYQTKGPRQFVGETPPYY
ncbi:hypothetical protein [Carnobacterium sp. TMP28]|uniref:hypothetical protein n=1 Tax=Carnobacterium sp. TMP28 TaxID=3397060 RepID=UPI0039DF5974